MLRDMWLILLLVSLVLTSSRANVDGILSKIEKVGEVARDMSDPITRHHVLQIQEKVKQKITGARLNRSQIAAANGLLAFILRKIKNGKITSSQIKHFISFAQSNRLDALLATWDKELLKRKP
ncbi:hypothetical protein GDO86_013514 [Hymenochirus boettgeri]|uniref:Uncharacterized protein n=1 Tax=Hymenochirus boettgeri TaxID=247094 RepID=A0A8T2IX21_9PIPI|nr:hypothetical protein GDO86_013514 [Hymenochirus boettgeri]